VAELDRRFECFRRLVKPVGFSDFADAVKALGQFWAVLNELPPKGASGDA
jgi:hypothetical protein